MSAPTLPPDILDAARSFLQILDRWNRIHSLTSLAPNERWEALILDSAALLPHLGAMAPGSVAADFGSGAGVPSVVLAASRPDVIVAAVDCNKKKTAFMRQAAMELGLGNLHPVLGDAGCLPPLGANFGTARAVGPLRLVLGWWARHSAPGAPFFAFKGPNWDPSEIGAGWAWEKHTYRLPTLGERHIVEIRAE